MGEDVKKRDCIRLDIGHHWTLAASAWSDCRLGCWGAMLVSSLAFLLLLWKQNGEKQTNMAPKKYGKVEPQGRIINILIFLFHCKIESMKS